VPSAAAVVVRAKPLTTLVISIDAFATALPDGSFTEPSIDPEFPDCAQLELAQAKKLKTKNKSLNFLKIIRISPLPLNWAMFVFVGVVAWKCGGWAMPQMALARYKRIR
jgi:hypothetical protein